MVRIEVDEDKMEKLAYEIEHSLRHLGKAMQCVEDFEYYKDDDDEEEEDTPTIKAKHRFRR